MPVDAFKWWFQTWNIHSAFSWMVWVSLKMSTETKQLCLTFVLNICYMAYTWYENAYAGEIKEDDMESQAEWHMPFIPIWN